MAAIGEVAASRMGEVTVACVPSAAYYFMPRVIARYHAQFPKVRIHVHDASANEVLSAVERGEADFGLNFMGSDEPDMEFDELWAREGAKPPEADDPNAATADAAAAPGESSVEAA